MKLEDYLSLKLDNLNKNTLQAKSIMDKNKQEQKNSDEKIKELNKKIDPTLEIFSPLKINEAIKQEIRTEKNKLKDLKATEQSTVEQLEAYEEERIALVEMLSEAREINYRLKRYEACNIQVNLNRLQRNILQAEEQIDKPDKLRNSLNKCKEIIGICFDALNPTSS